MKCTRSDLFPGFWMQSARRGVGFLVLCVIYTFVGQAAFAENADDALRKGYRAYAEQDYEKALEVYRAARKEDAPQFRLRYSMGNALYRLERYSEAHRQFEAAAQSSDPALASKAYYNAGNSLFRMAEALKAPKEQIELLTRAIDRYQLARTLASSSEAIHAAAGVNIELARRALAQLKKEQQQEQLSNSRSADSPTPSAPQQKEGKQEEAQGERSPTPQPTAPERHEEAKEAPSQTDAEEQQADQRNGRQGEKRGEDREDSRDAHQEPTRSAHEAAEMSGSSRFRENGREERAAARALEIIEAEERRRHEQHGLAVGKAAPGGKDW